MNVIYFFQQTAHKGGNPAQFDIGLNQGYSTWDGSGATRQNTQASKGRKPKNVGPPILDF